MKEKFKLLLDEWRGQKGSLIPLLQQTQELFGYLPQDAMQQIAAAAGQSPAQVYGVATFYAQFRFEPTGKHIIKICHGTACHVVGVDLLDTTLQNELGIGPGQTTADGLFTLEQVACLGCCSLAPVMMIDDEVYGRLTGGKLKKALRKYK
jgi:NADH-quinone oxidoreductase subunit E